MNKAHAYIVAGLGSALFLGVAWLCAFEPEQDAHHTERPAHMTQNTDSDLTGQQLTSTAHSKTTNSAFPAIKGVIEANSSSVNSYNDSSPPSDNLLTQSKLEQLNAIATSIIEKFEQFSTDQALPVEKNVFLLQMFSQQLAEHISASEFDFIESSLGELPEGWSDATRRMLEMYQAEQELLTQVNGKILQDPERFKQELLTKHKEMLGAELYHLISAEDSHLIPKNERLLASDSNQSLAENTAVPTTSSLPNEQQQWIDQWRNQELSEDSLKALLGSKLEPEQVEHVIAMNENEQSWLTKIGDFLDEYRYIEQAGLQGSDEKQMRQELIERHFSEEDQAIAERFLFSLYEVK